MTLRTSCPALLSGEVSNSTPQAAPSSEASAGPFCVAVGSTLAQSSSVDALIFSRLRTRELAYRRENAFPDHAALNVTGVKPLVSALSCSHTRLRRHAALIRRLATHQMSRSLSMQGTILNGAVSNNSKARGNSGNWLLRFGPLKALTRTVRDEPSA